MLIILLYSCRAHIAIEESTTVKNYCKDTHEIKTKVKVKNWIGKNLSLEMEEVAVVGYSKIDSTQAAQRELADSCCYRIERVLNRGGK